MSSQGPLRQCWRPEPGKCALIGVLHAPPLPGAPGYGGDFEHVVSQVLRDAESLAGGGVDGLLLENFGDVPFFPSAVPAATVSSLTRLAAELRQRFACPLGLNVLRNDGLAALAIAQAVGGDFIRVNVLCGARLTDQGLVQGIAHELLRQRQLLHAQHVAILADVDVKHSVPLAERPFLDEVQETLHRGLADGLIVTGAATGAVTDADQVRSANQVAGGRPIWVGSGVTAENFDRYLPWAAGLLVGTWFKRDGKLDQPVDGRRVQQLADRLRGWRAP